MFSVGGLPVLAAVPGTKVEYTAPIQAHVVYAQPLGGLLTVLLRDCLHFRDSRNGNIETIPVWVLGLRTARFVIQVLVLV
jgi:hypothetical protein